MFPSFVPQSADQLTESTSIELASAIQQRAIATSITAEPIKTTYIQQGTGQIPVMLLHGFDSSVLEFRRLVPLLATQTTTWAIDLLGFGFTDRPEIEFTPDQIKQHLFTTWKTLIGEPVILVGASMGGAAALDFALTYPEAVQGLVLIDSAGFATSTPPTFRPVAYLGAEVLKRLWVRDRISKAAYHDPTFASADALCCSALHLSCPGWRRAMAAFTCSGGYTFLADRIPSIILPSLILWGESDRILGTDDATKFEQALVSAPTSHPASQLQWIAASGHVPHLEQPQRTAQHILDFAQRLSEFRVTSI